MFRLEKSLGRSCLCTNTWWEGIKRMGSYFAQWSPRQEAAGSNWNRKFHLKIRKSVPAVGVAKHCHSLLREVVESTSLKRVKTHLDTGLSNLLEVTLIKVGIVGLDVPWGLATSVILFEEFCRSNWVLANCLCYYLKIKSCGYQADCLARIQFVLLPSAIRYGTNSNLPVCIFLISSSGYS